MKALLRPKGCLKVFLILVRHYDDRIWANFGLQVKILFNADTSRRDHLGHSQTKSMKPVTDGNTRLVNIEQGVKA